VKVFVGGYKGVSPVSVLIKGATWSPYSHVSLIRDDGAAIESWHRGGVQSVATPFTLHTLGTVVDLFELNYPKEYHQNVWDSALQKVGAEYDFRALAGFIPCLRWLWKDNPNRWFCSHQIADDCSVDGFYRLFNNTTPTYKMSPGFVLSSPWLEKLGSMQSMMEFRGMVNG